ncbi:Uncharacterised protein [Streptococcus suis]|uniref:Uncharacterized protein n=1 Tax=Streptococcus suis TaxID=1307 RepID=A0A0Z8GYS2_STRSU|nr:Uncharacterised protein [Streptococcus suis]
MWRKYFLLVLLAILIAGGHSFDLNQWLRQMNQTM